MLFECRTKCCTKPVRFFILKKIYSLFPYRIFSESYPDEQRIPSKFTPHRTDDRKFAPPRKRFGTPSKSVCVFAILRLCLAIPTDIQQQYGVFLMHIQSPILWIQSARFHPIRFPNCCLPRSAARKRIFAAKILFAFLKQGSPPCQMTKATTRKSYSEIRIERKQAL